MKKLIIFLVCMFIVCNITCKSEEDNHLTSIKGMVQSSLEKAYFEGQKDVLSGDVRIKRVGDKWTWIKSPWEGGRPPIYDPLKDPSQKNDDMKEERKEEDEEINFDD